MLRGWNSKSQWMRWPAICLLARKLNSPGINLLWVLVPLLRICASQFPVFFLQIFPLYLQRAWNTLSTVGYNRLIFWQGPSAVKCSCICAPFYSTVNSKRAGGLNSILLWREHGRYIIVPRRRSFKMRTRRGTCTRREGDLACVFLPNSHGPSFFLYVYYQPRVYKPVNNNPKRVSLLWVGVPPWRKGTFRFPFKKFEWRIFIYTKTSVKG